jgi:hypothetical protein
MTLGAVILGLVMAMAGVAVFMAAGPWIGPHLRVIHSTVTVTIGVGTVFVGRIIGWGIMTCFCPPSGYVNIINTVVVVRFKIKIGIN